MNSLTVTLISAGALFLGYRYYGRFIENRLVRPDDSIRTPAETVNDGVDYHPSRTSLLWGNHFASIAGAGPIIGPILAVSFFGWGLPLLWVILGSIFMGAVHDYLSLMLSVRHNGRGIYDLAEPVLGTTGKNLVSLLVYLMLTLIITVFMVSVANALVSKPALVIPTFGLVAIALLMSLCIQKLGMNDILVTALGIIGAYALIWAGYYHPVTMPASWSPWAVTFAWCTVLSLYCLFASVSPIWLLLQPRDFIASVKLFVGMGLGFLGVIFIHPVISAPFHTGGFMSGGRPVWPILFITVACGAISGFHTLVATGTSSRQLARESSGKLVAFGGMIMEGALAVLVIMVVAAGLKWGNAPAGITGSAADAWFGQALRDGWIVAFGTGFGNMVGGLGIPYLTVPIAGLLGAVMVKSFILTTLDSGTRLGRFLVAETLGKHIPVLKNNRAAATMVILLPGFLLAVTNSWEAVWKLFGASNQLIAGAALITITAYLVRAGLPRIHTLGPGLFMLATSAAALVWEAFAPATGYFTGSAPRYDLGIICLILLALAALVAVKSAKTLFRDAGGEEHTQPPRVRHPKFR